MSDDAKKYRTALEFTTDSKDVEAGADKMSKVLDHLGGVAGKTKEAIGGIGRGLSSSVLSGIGLSLGTGLIGGMKSLVHESFAANMELGSLRKSIAGTSIAFENWKPGVDMLTRVKASMRDAVYVTDDFEEAESRLAIPMEDLAASYRYLGGTAIQQYGQSQKQATDFTIDAAAAAKALGSDIGGVSMGITRLLETRGLKGVDPVTNFLRSALGKTKELKTMAPDKLFALIGEKLHTLAPAAEEMSQGIGGMMFRIKDFFGDTIRDIGGPAFAFLGSKVKEWSKALQMVGDDGKKLYETIGVKILDATKKLTSLIETLANHWKEIAVVVGGIKLANLATDAGRWAATMATAEKSATGIKGALGGIRNLGPLVIALEIGGAAGGWLAEQLNEGGQWGKTKAGKLWQSAMSTIAQHLPGGITDEEVQQKRLDNERLQFVAKDLMRANRRKHGLDQLTGLPTATTLKYGDPYTGKPIDMVRLGLVSRTQQATSAIPDTSELTRRGRPINNFYGDIKVDQKFADADPDNVWVQLKEALEGAAERTMVGRGHHPFGPGVG